MSKDKKIEKVKGSDIILVVKFEEKGKVEKNAISADSFSMNSFKGKTIVKGHDYYIEKALKLGAKKES